MHTHQQKAHTSTPHMTMHALPRTILDPLLPLLFVTLDEMTMHALPRTILDPLLPLLFVTLGVVFVCACMYAGPQLARASSAPLGKGFTHDKGDKGKASGHDKGDKGDNKAHARRLRAQMDIAYDLLQCGAVNEGLALLTQVRHAQLPHPPS
jgi:hypothetical protein